MRGRLTAGNSTATWTAIVMHAGWKKSPTVSAHAARGALMPIARTLCDHHAVTIDRARWNDLVSEIQALVWEEAPLHEVTGQVAELLGKGRDVVHGPWTEAECRSVLLPWHKAGWIELIADVRSPSRLKSAAWHAQASRTGDFLVLAANDADGLLRDPTRWVVGTADGHVMLSRTDEGDSHEYADWVALVSAAGE